MDTPVPMMRDDDIANLRVRLALPELAYVDFSRQEDMLRALQRWPLLVELETWDAERRRRAATSAEVKP